MSETSTENPWEKRITAVLSLVTLGLVSAVMGTYLYGNNTSPKHVAEASAQLKAPPEVVVAMLHDVQRRPEWRPDVEQVGRKSDPTDAREVWRELDDEGDRFDFEVVERRSDGIVLRTDAAEQIGYEATWTFRVEAAPAGSRLTVTEEGFVDNPLFRGVFWLRDGPAESVVDELRWVGTAVDGQEPTIEALKVEER